MALVTLTAMELVLGIDNIVFIAIVSGRLPAGQQEKARRLGLFGSMFLRIALLLTITAMMRLPPSFTCCPAPYREKTLSSCWADSFPSPRPPTRSTTGIDSIITAVGMARHVGVMIFAIVLAVGAMMLFAGAVSAFIDRHPTVKMLALGFLLLIGVMLVAEGFGKHIERGTIYFAMGFSLFVELLNLKVRRATGT